MSNLDPHKAIFDFKDSQRRNNPEYSLSIFTNFMHHFFKKSEFHYGYATKPFREWLKRHGLAGSVLEDTMKAICRWGLNGRMVDLKYVITAIITNVLTAHINSQVYPGPNFPTPDEKLIEDLETAANAQKPSKEDLAKVNKAIKDAAENTKLGM